MLLPYPKEDYLTSDLQQRRPRIGPVAIVELVIAGHQQHRYRSVREALEPSPGRVDVTGQHQQIGVRGRLRIEWFGLEV